HGRRPQSPQRRRAAPPARNHEGDRARMVRTRRNALPDRVRWGGARALRWTNMFPSRVGTLYMPRVFRHPLERAHIDAAEKRAAATRVLALVTGGGGSSGGSSEA